MGKKKSKAKKRPSAAQLEKLRTEKDFLKYMKLLRLFAKKYCVMIVVNDTPVGPATTLEMTQALIDIGLRMNLYGRYRCAYAAMIDAGELIFEDIRSDKVEVKKLIGKSEVKLISLGLRSGVRRGFIQIDGKECSLNKRGLNIVVYDKVAGTVLDTTNFDTFVEEVPRFFSRTDAQIVEEFVEAHPNVTVVCSYLPIFPVDPVRPKERFIIENGIHSETIVANLHQHVSALNQYFDEDEIVEVLSVPKSYFDMNGIRRFEDLHSKYINISGGHRETACQPDQFQRTIFLFGGCMVFGFGSDDNRTIASYLQVNCNRCVPDARIIVQNYGFYLGGAKVTNEEISKLVRSLPVKPGDILIYFLSEFSSSADFPCVDLSQAAEQPRDYEVFFDEKHYTPDGNRLIAEGLFKGLMDLGLLQQSKTVSGDYPESDLGNTHNLADYLRLLKKYAQKYCVLVSSWEASGGSGFTEEISDLYREVGFQADLRGKPHCAYAAVIDAGELAYEEQCEDTAQCIDVTLTDEEFNFEANIVSIGLNSPQSEKVPIEINGASYSSKDKGLYFVVYDKAARTAIDAVNFDISSNSVLCRWCLDRGPDKVLPSGSTLSSFDSRADTGVPTVVNPPAAQVIQKELPFEADTYKDLAEYKKALTGWYDRTFSRTIGSVVMNCNPFTLGHRFLIEQALTQCDFLIIFVVQEDMSRFPFEDRLRLVKEGVADLKNVAVLPSGKFVLSSLTFSEYFNKSELQDRTIDSSLDVTVFAREIAPCLHITKRFAGEEPFDTVTRQYNETMRRILPEYGIEFVEIPRKTDVLGKREMAISASRVRDLLEKGDFDAIKPLVPENTFRYLKGL